MIGKGKTGAPGEIRTPDLLLRRQSLYPAELRARPDRVYMRESGAGNARISLVGRLRAQLRYARVPSLAELHKQKGRSTHLPLPFPILIFSAAGLPASAATAAASAAVASASTASTCAASGAFGFGTSFIYVERTAAVLGAIQGGDSFVALFRIRHLDEPEPARSSSVAVRQDRHPIHLSILLEQLAQLIFPSVEAEIPNEDILHADASVMELFESGCLRRERG